MAQVRALGVSNELLEEGLNELEQVIAAAVQRAPGKVVADLSIARGLDYYTGTVVETRPGGPRAARLHLLRRPLRRPGQQGQPQVPRRRALHRRDPAGLPHPQPGPGQGFPLRPHGRAGCANDDDSWGAAQDVAAQLRSRGIATEVAAKAEKFGKQIKFADRRGIPFVWFTDDDGKHQVKDIRSGRAGRRRPGDAGRRPTEDLHVQVTATPASCS